MTLKAHLKLHSITLADFAERIGEKERAVRNWYYGVRQPSLACVAKIEAATGGAVALLDWLDTADAA